MDVLAYSAFNRQKRLEAEVNQKRHCLTQIDDASRNASTSPETVCWLKCIEPCLLREPYHTEYWDRIPGLTGPGVQGFKVCGTGSSFNYGVCCQWTVPAGVTRARFQLWGAGGGSGSNCLSGCFVATPFGATGAYASVIIPVTPADTYTLCSGCATGCFAASPPSSRNPGCASFVTGNGLCNFCAEGGGGRLGEWMSEFGSCSTCYVSSTATCTGSGIVSSGSGVCSFQTTGGVLPYVASASYFGTTTSATNPSIVYGIRGMWAKYGSTCERLTCGNSNVICNVHPPIYGFEKESMCLGIIGGTCNYTPINPSSFASSAGYLKIPGAGGWWGANLGCGGCFSSDIGRMGMVCVSFC
jgi:hypothetical protein